MRDAAVLDDRRLDSRGAQRRAVRVTLWAERVVFRRENERGRQVGVGRRAQRRREAVAGLSAAAEVGAGDRSQLAHNEDARDAQGPRRPHIDVRTRQVDHRHFENLEHQRVSSTVPVGEAHRRSDARSRRDSAHSDPTAIDAQRVGGVEQPIDRRDPLFDLRRIAVLGRQRVIDGDHDGAQGDGTPTAGGIRRRIVDAADPERAAEEGHHRRERGVARRDRPIHTHAHVGMAGHGHLVLRRRQRRSGHADRGELAAVPGERRPAVTRSRRGHGASPVGPRSGRRGARRARRPLGASQARDAGPRLHGTRTDPTPSLVEQVPPVDPQALREERVQRHQTRRSTRAPSRRIDSCLPRSSIDSNSGGDTRRPLSATRSGP